MVTVLTQDISYNKQCYAHSDIQVGPSSGLQRIKEYHYLQFGEHAMHQQHLNGRVDVEKGLKLSHLHAEAMYLLL